jgi:Ran-binding protein 3
MRKEAVYTLLLNATLFKGMRCALGQDPRYIRFSVFENGAATHYNLRVSSLFFQRCYQAAHLRLVLVQVSNAKIAAELLEEIHAHIP